MRTTEQRFWSKVNKDGPIPKHMPHLGKCWIWTAALFKSGYGNFYVGEQNKRAHRVSWELFRGPILRVDDSPHGTCVLHECDNRRCVNPDHLRLGTQAENIADRESKHRWIPPRGEGHASSKLTEKQVMEIINSPSRKKSELAREMGVGETTIATIMKGTSWRHLRTAIQSSKGATP